MGKAQIISGGPDGLYNVGLVRDTTRITAEIAAITARLEVLTTAIEEAEDARNDAMEAVDTAMAALNTAITELINKQTTAAAVSDLQKVHATAQQQYSTKYSNYNLLILEKESKTKRLALLEDALASDYRDNIWCADLTENLAAGAEVGTIEINGEDTQIIIYPAGALSALQSSLLQPVLSSTPAGVFYNQAILPAWQRWKPTYRTATITAINGNLCSVLLSAAASSQQDLNINPGVTTLANVPIEYMSGINGSAFAVGDRVVVEFTNQDWTRPKVIGFENNPRASLSGFLVFDVISDDYNSETLYLASLSATGYNIIHSTTYTYASGPERLIGMGFDHATNEFILLVEDGSIKAVRVSTAGVVNSTVTLVMPTPEWVDNCRGYVDKNTGDYYITTNEEVNPGYDPGDPRYSHRYFYVRYYRFNSLGVLQNSWNVIAWTRDSNTDILGNSYIYPTIVKFGSAVKIAMVLAYYQYPDAKAQYKAILCDELNGSPSTYVMTYHDYPNCIGPMQKIGDNLYVEFRDDTEWEFEKLNGVYRIPANTLTPPTYVSDYMASPGVLWQPYISGSMESQNRFITELGKVINVTTGATLYSITEMGTQMTLAMAEV